MKRVVLPLRGRPMCGHSLGPMGTGDLMMGREESLMAVVRNGVEYVSRVYYGSCSLCNKAERERIEREIDQLEGR